MVIYDFTRYSDIVHGLRFQSARLLINAITFVESLVRSATSHQRLVNTWCGPLKRISAEGESVRQRQRVYGRKKKSEKEREERVKKADIVEALGFVVALQQRGTRGRAG